MKHHILTLIKQNQILFVLFLVILAWFLFLIKDIVLIAFISFIVMATFHPIVEWLARHRVPRVLGVFIVYLLTICLLILIVFPLVPFFAEQAQALIKRFPEYLQKTGSSLGVNVNANFIHSYTTSHIEAIGSNALLVTTKLFGSIFSILAMIVISFYLLLSHNQIKKEFLEQFPKNKRNHAKQTLELVEDKLGAWLRGQILLSVTIGILAWVALTLLHIPYSLPLALLAGLFEIIPTIGPILSAIPALIVGFSVSPFTAVLVAAAYIIIQLLENNLIVPKIMESAVGLNPVVIILSVMIGGQLMGIIGALLSIPFVSLLVILFKNI